MPAAQFSQEPMLATPPTPPLDLDEMQQRCAPLGRIVVPDDPNARPGEYLPRSRPSSPLLPGQGQDGGSAREPAAIQFYHTSSIPDAATGTSDASWVQEPSLGVNDAVIFWTGNWYASVSGDAGQTWSYINPYTRFAGANGGFCCDQIVYYDDTRNVTFWLLQYVADANTNTQRLAVSQGQNGVTSNSWFYYDWTPASFGFPASGYWLDFPDLSVSDNYLYLTTNVFLIGSGLTSTAVIARFPLDPLSQGQGFSYSYFVSGDRPSLRCTHGADGTMYFGTHNSNSSFRIFRWAESSGTIFWDNVAHTAYNNPSTTTPVAPGPDGRDWAGSADGRVLGAWRARGRLGFMWNAAQGGAYAYPHVWVVEFQESDRTLVRESQVWSPSVAWLYPSAHTNWWRDWVGGTIAFGGGSYYPGATAWIADDDNGFTFAPLDNAVFASGNSGPISNRWGDYLTTRYHSRYTDTWVGSGWANVGGPYSGANAVPRYVWFGRPGWVWSCAHGNDCDNNDPCSGDRCLVGYCHWREPIRYGDVDLNGFVTLADLFCVLDGFGGDFSACSRGNMDISPCEGNNVITIADLFAVLDAFAGEDACCGGPAPASAELPRDLSAGDMMKERPRSESSTDDVRATRARAALTLEADHDVLGPGEATVVDVYVSGSGQLRGYEFAVSVTGGDSGQLAVESVEIDTSRPDHVFAGQEVVDAADLGGGRALAAVMDEAVRFRSRVYLGTVYLRASDDARGVFVVNLDNQRSSFLADTDAALPLRPTSEVTITVP